MGSIRHDLTARPWAALLIVLACLASRLFVPAGFMPMHEGGRTLILPCSGHGPMAMPAASHKHGMPEPGSHLDAPCGFGGFVQAAGGGEPTRLAIVNRADGQATVAGALQPAPIVRAIRLRPPLRAPPGALRTA